MYKATNHIQNKRRLKNLEADIALTLEDFPGLTAVYRNGKPVELIGNFKVEDNNGIEQGNWDIKILIPMNYPYEFPTLYETSTKIKRSEDTHINEAGKACVELDILEIIIARKGILIYDFVKKYVFKFFCWSLLYEAGECDKLSYWGHKEAGHKEFFYELLETTKDDFILNCFNLIKVNNIPQRNNLCFCGSKKKYKYCHNNTINKLKRFDEVFLNHFTSLFQTPIVIK